MPAASIESASASSRLHALNTVRAGAMLMVVVAHCLVAYGAGCVGVLPWPFDFGTQDVISGTLVRLIRPLPVPIFFFVAGFLARAAVERRGPGEFARTRATRIGLPLLLAAATVFPLVCLVGGWGLLGQHASVDHWIWHSNFHRLIASELVGPAHLWFLRDLLMLSVLYAAAMLVWLPLRRRLGTQNGAARPWLASLTACIAASVALVWLRPRTIIGFTNTFAPDLLELAYNGAFFLAGSAYRVRDGLLARCGGRWWVWVALACMAGGGYWAAMEWVIPSGVSRAPIVMDAAGMVCWIDGPSAAQVGQRAVVACASAAYVWLALRAVLAAATSRASGQSPRARWLADSSFWVYLAHLPIALTLQVLLRPLTLPGVVKAAAICAITVGVLLVAYQYLVRYRWLGRLLHGRRRRPDRAQPRRVVEPMSEARG
jgi:peptidoglycan/LPS O-acetylase OafA/YrhL